MDSITIAGEDFTATYGEANGIIDHLAGQDITEQRIARMPYREIVNRVLRAQSEIRTRARTLESEIKQLPEAAVAETIERAVAGLLPEPAQPGALQVCRALLECTKGGPEPDVPDKWDPRKLDFLYAHVVMHAVAGVADIKAKAADECVRIMEEIERRMRAGEA